MIKNINEKIIDEILKSSAYSRIYLSDNALVELSKFCNISLKSLKNDHESYKKEAGGDDTPPPLVIG